MILKSKIKEVFSDELIKLIGSVCDTRRIDSNQEKMRITQQLLKSYGIRFDVLGGATNRLSLYISGFVFKIAMDRQGYKDNLMEYALSKELQPYVTKTFETNGYISIAETVRMMTREEWQLRRLDILRVLDILGTSYLLGDVGYITKNFTNWGIRDDGNVVILDYAYVHRGTGKLFLCDVCGDGMLTYDSTFSELRCNNVTGSCGARYTYIERKMIEGDQVDYDMIDDVRYNQSIKLPKGIKLKTVKVDETDENGMLVDGNTVIIRSPEEHQRWEMEVSKMARNVDKAAMLDVMIKINTAKDPKEKDKWQKKLDALYEESKPEELKDVEVKIAYDEDDYRYEDDDDDDDDYTVSEGTPAPRVSISEMIRMARKAMGGVYVDIDTEDDYDDGIVLDDEDCEIHLDDDDVPLDDDDDDDGGTIDLPCIMDELANKHEEVNESYEVEYNNQEVEKTPVNEPIIVETEEGRVEVPAEDTEDEQSDDTPTEDEEEPIDYEVLTEEEADALAREIAERLNGGYDVPDDGGITIDGKPLEDVM